ncbi:MAG: hypothetical protein EZS28_045124, partial [Streblomastix strix]
MQADPFHRGMEIYKGRSVSDEGNLTILEMLTESFSPIRQLQSTQLIEIEGERGIIEQVNSERIRRWNSRRSDERRFEMDQSMFCYTKTGKRKMEKNFRLQDSQQTSLFQSLHHGRHTYTTRIAKAWRLDDKNKLGISISPYNHRQRILTIPRIYSEQQVLFLIREVLRVRIVAYRDDIIIIHEERQKLDSISQSIINILTNFGWKISIKKSILEPTQSITFLGWEINMEKDQLMTTTKRQNKIRQVIAIWRRVVQKGTQVKVKYLASFFGSQKLPSASNLERWTPHEETKQSQGMDCTEIIWWKAEVDKNKPIQATIVQPQAILSTDASMNSWGACLKLLNPEELILFQGDWASLGKEKEELLQVEDPKIIIANFIAQLGEEKSTDSNQTICTTAICT